MTAEPQSVPATQGAAERGANGYKLSAQCRARIEEEKTHFPQARAALLPALHLAQAEIGYLPRAVIEEGLRAFDAAASA